MNTVSSPSRLLLVLGVVVAVLIALVGGGMNDAVDGEGVVSLENEAPADWGVTLEQTEGPAATVVDSVRSEVIEDRAHVGIRHYHGRLIWKMNGASVANAEVSPEWGPHESKLGGVVVVSTDQDGQFAFDLPAERSPEKLRIAPWEWRRLLFANRASLPLDIETDAMDVDLGNLKIGSDDMLSVTVRGANGELCARPIGFLLDSNQIARPRTPKFFADSTPAIGVAGKVTFEPRSKPRLLAVGDLPVDGVMHEPMIIELLAGVNEYEVQLTRRYASLELSNELGALAPGVYEVVARLREPLQTSGPFWRGMHVGSLESSSASFPLTEHRLGLQSRIVSRQAMFHGVTWDPSGEPLSLFIGGLPTGTKTPVLDLSIHRRGTPRPALEARRVAGSGSRPVLFSTGRGISGKRSVNQLVWSTSIEAPFTGRVVVQPDSSQVALHMPLPSELDLPDGQVVLVDSFRSRMDASDVDGIAQLVGSSAYTGLLASSYGADGGNVECCLGFAGAVRGRGGYTGPHSIAKVHIEVESGLGITELLFGHTDRPNLRAARSDDGNFVVLSTCGKDHLIAYKRGALNVTELLGAGTKHQVLKASAMGEVVFDLALLPEESLEFLPSEIVLHRTDAEGTSTLVVPVKSLGASENLDIAKIKVQLPAGTYKLSSHHQNAFTPNNVFAETRSLTVTKGQTATLKLRY